ncbi:MAG: phosphoglycerate mutase family protein [Muribaculaceae bacterium]|nr:phosphoglycerate mutase family protein [Muribaculaceae bacterium]
MTEKEIEKRAERNRERAREVLAEAGIIDILQTAGCRVELVGSLRMGLLASHRDIDLHVYSSGISAEKSFAMMARVAEGPRVAEIRCINGLHTSEHCVAWHVFYKAGDEETWQIDIIHIEAGTEYDGYFEKMADRIKAVMTDEEREAILRLKFETSESTNYHGVEYYEAVIGNGVRTAEELAAWVEEHRKGPQYYWIP